METLGGGYPFTTAHLIETFDPNFTSVGPRITTTGGTENVNIQHHDALLIIHKLLIKLIAVNMYIAIK